MRCSLKLLEAFGIFLVILIISIYKQTIPRSDTEIIYTLKDECIELIKDVKTEHKDKILEFLENEKFIKLILYTILDLKIDDVYVPTLETDKEGIYIIAKYTSSLNKESRKLKIVCLLLN